jgi:transcriptional regulator with XRE-family HTH domain
MTKPRKTAPAGGYAPVPFDPAAFIAKRHARDPAFRAAYVALEDEFQALDALRVARREAGLTLAQVAQRMGVKQSALARVEASLGSRQHTPSLETLRKYAQAVGCRLEIRLVRRSEPVAGSGKAKAAGRVRGGKSAVAEPDKRVRPGNALTSIGRRLGLTQDDFAVIERMRDKAPAKPLRFDR